jgi:hypothetical protein
MEGIHIRFRQLAQNVLALQRSRGIHRLEGSDIDSPRAEFCVAVPLYLSAADNLMQPASLRPEAVDSQHGQGVYFRRERLPVKR